MNTILSTTIGIEFRRRPFRNAVLCTVFCLGAAVAQAQQDASCQKIGFADIQMIAQHMPETRQIEAELASLGGQLQNQLKAKYNDYNEKLSLYEKAAATTEPSMLAHSRDELIRLETEIQKFASDAEAIYLKKQEQLTQPVLLRINKTIEEVAAENKYSIILNTELPAGQRLIIFGAKQYDISEQVLHKMGLSMNSRKRE